MPLARTSGGTPGEASSGVGVLGLTSTRPPPSASDHSSRAPRRRSTLPDGMTTSSSSWAWRGVALVGVGHGLEVEVVDEGPLLHAAHLEPQGQVAGSGSCAMASCTILWASGVRVTTGVVVWRSSVVVAMEAVYGVPSAGRPLPASAVRGRSVDLACARCNVPGRGHDTDRRARMDQLRGRRGGADVGLRRHVPDEQLDLHLRQRVPGRAHRARARARPGLLQLRRPPGQQEGRPPGREGGGHARRPTSGRTTAPRRA